MTTHDLSKIHGLRQEDLEKALSVLRKESDRGAILVAIAILDGVFETRLRQLFSHGNSDARSRLLSRTFSSFSAKVDAAFCIGMIPKFLYHDIRLLNDLRNQCAHRWADFVIDGEIVRRFVEPMSMKKILQAPNVDNPDFFPDSLPPRKMAISTFAALIAVTNIFTPKSGEVPSAPE